MNAIFGAIIKQLYDALASPDSAGSSSEELGLIVLHLKGLIFDVARGIIYVLAQVYGAKQYEYPLAESVAHNLERAQIDTNSAISHVAFTILPNSLYNLSAWIFANWIAPIRKDIAWLKWHVNFLLGWRGQINYWRKHTVDPFIISTRAFIKWFRTWPQAILTTWHDWFANPLHFAKWADPPIAATMPAYLMQKASKPDRDALNNALLYAWPEDTAAVQALLVRWLLSPA